MTQDWNPDLLAPGQGHEPLHKHFSRRAYGACSWETSSQVWKAPQVAGCEGGTQGTGAECRHQHSVMDEHGTTVERGG